MCVPIQRVHRDSSGVITHVGGSTRDGVPWGLTVDEAARLQEERLFTWFVEVPAGQKVDIWVKTSPTGRKFLTTSPDGVSANNLDSLPNMPNPLSGTLPAFPLNVPGSLTTSLMRVTSISYTGNNKLTPIANTPLAPDGTVYAYEQRGTFWRATPRWFYVYATVPFPAEYSVSLNAISIERVQSNPARRRDLEAAGKGWWSLNFILTRPDGTIDPNKPSRMTEVEIVINPGSFAWKSRNFAIGVSAYSMNPYCPSHGSGVVFRIRQPAAPEVPPPVTAIVPSVVGQRLDTALRTLWNLGFTRVFPLGPVDISSNLNVDSQNPAAGSTARLTESIFLTTSVATPKTGINKIIINNQSNRAKEVDIWLFDMTTGNWNKKTSIAYRGQGEVELDDGHTYQIAAVDPTLLNCRSSRPDEVSCVYAAPQGIFVGDDDGNTTTWQVT